MSTEKKGGTMNAFEPLGLSKIFDIPGNTSPEFGSAIRQKFQTVCMFFIPFRELKAKNGKVFVEDFNDEVSMQNIIQEIDPDSETVIAVNDYTVCSKSWTGMLIGSPQMFARLTERHAITAEDVVFCDSDMTPYIIANFKPSAIKKIVACKKSSPPTKTQRNEGDYSKALEAWVKYRTQGQESQRDKLSKRLTQLCKEKEEIQKKQLTINQEVSEINRTLAYLSNNPTQEEQYFVDEFNRFNGKEDDAQHIDGVLRAEFDVESNAFVVYTTTIYGTRHDSTKKYFFGTYRIRIPLSIKMEYENDEGKMVTEATEEKHITIENLTMQCPQILDGSDKFRGFHHPHIQRINRVCLGDYKPIVNQLFKTGKQHDEIAMIVIQSLRSWSTTEGDDWGSSVVFWPEVDPVTLAFLDSRFDYLKEKEKELHEQILKEVKQWK